MYFVPPEIECRSRTVSAEKCPGKDAMKERTANTASHVTCFLLPLFSTMQRTATQDAV